MELNKIEKLLERYDEGETSLAEEKQLREYFLKNEIPVHLRSYQLMFRFSERQGKEQLKETVQVKTKSNRYIWT
ncbi:MAG: hypothetical protein KJO51_03605, partial [Gramella sp.]|nr:hypothetical protein [Christiangramia sp.]